MATDRTKFLDDERAFYVDRLAELGKAKDDFLADVDKADRRDNIEAILIGLLGQVALDELEESWKQRLDDSQAATTSEDNNVAHWDSEIGIVTSIIAEIDRLLLL